MLSGVAMGGCYDIAGRIHSDRHEFETGIPIAEVLWGSYLWLAIIACIIGGDAPLPATPLSQAGGPSARRWVWALLYAALAAFLGVAVGSAAEYETVAQPDMRNKDESETGLLVAVALFAAPLAAVAAFSLWHLKSERGAGPRAPLPDPAFSAVQAWLRRGLWATWATTWCSGGAARAYTVYLAPRTGSEGESDYVPLGEPVSHDAAVAEGDDPRHRHVPAWLAEHARALRRLLQALTVALVAMVTALTAVCVVRFRWQQACWKEFCG
jgi:hypothetical protein